MLDAPLFGSADNHSFSTMQVNISPLSKTDLTASLGFGGRSHADKNDDPSGITLLICISNLRPDTDPGKFYLGETREWCTLQPFSLILFRGRSPHGGTQAISRDPDPVEKRINLILYPRKEFVNRYLPILYPCAPKDHLADYSFFRDGGACFGTEEYHKAWCTRELFRHFIVQNKKYGKVENFQATFAALTGKRYIDPDSDEGQDIIKSIGDANEIMESVRLPWKDGTKSVSNLRRKTKSNRHAPKAPQPPSPNPQDPPAPVPSGSHATRSLTDTDPTLTSGRRYPTRSRRGAESSTSLEEANTQPTYPPTGQTSSVAGDLNDQADRTEDLSGTRSSSDNLSPSQYLSPSDDDAEVPYDTAEATDKAEAEVIETDISDATDDAEAELPDVVSNNATDDAEAELLDVVSNATPLPTEKSLAERLLRIPLFDHSKMTAEMARVQDRANLLRTQFFKRTPQLSCFLPKPSALPLPDTDGLTLVEQLIQLGERCQWTTQKFEHLWFYQQALKEHFFLTLLSIEPLFDISKLTRIFKDQNRNRGAGVCSGALMDKIVCMVSRSQKDSEERVVKFDAAKILGQQFQPKFCASVQVTVQPYKGSDPYLHMAQHFREVILISPNAHLRWCSVCCWHGHCKTFCA
jgi:hypothetical protein